MTSHRDPMTTLEKLRPRTMVDTAWPASARDRAVEWVLSSDAVAVPPPVPARRSRRRRVILTAALTAALVPAGVGVATAGGALPQSFLEQLAFWTHDTGGRVDVETARRVAQGPGPDGRVLSVWASTGDNGTLCVSPMFEAPGDLARPAPTNAQLGGGQCANLDQEDQPFGTMSGSADEQGLHMMWGAAGTAVRAEVRLGDGSVRAAVPAEGMYFVWYLADHQVDAPVLVGYDADGGVVAQRQLPNLIAQKHIGG